MALQIQTKMKILKPAKEVFAALIDPAKMANYWFSSGSARLEPGKTVTWRYDEYDAQVDINVSEIELNRKIVYGWGGTHSGEDRVVIITLHALDSTGTVIEVIEAGFEENDPALISTLLEQKEGWVYMLTCLKGYLEYGVNLRVGLVM